MSATPAPGRPPVGTGTMLAYGAGMLGTQIFRDMPAVLLPMFMATMLGIPAWLTGIVVLVSKLWLVVCDPMMGNWSDKAKARHGRAPFLLTGGVLTSAGLVALFSFTGFSSPAAAAVAVGLMFFVASTAFSAFSVPYLALASELSDDPHERTKILSFRLVFAVLGVVVSVGLAQPIVQSLGGGPGAWQTMALILGGVSLLSMLATPLGLRGRVAPDASGGGSGGWLAGLRAARRNKPYQIIIVTQFIQATAMACGYTVVGFLFVYVVGKVNLLPPFILLMAMGTFATQPLWVAMSRGLGKAATFVIATAGWAVVTVSWFWVQPGGEPFMTLPGLGTLGTQEALVILRGIGIGVTNAGFVLMIFSMLTDTINDGRAADASVDEGLLSGIFTAVEKLGFACGPVLAGFTLSLSGFQSSVTGITKQSPEAVRGIVMAFSAVPATLVVVSLVFFVVARSRLPKA